MNLRGLIKYWFYRDTTQHGEFRRMWRLAGRDCPRTIVDVGANDGFYASNSYPFVARGWRSLLIEPHPGAFAKLSKLHSANPQVTCLNIACAEAEGELPLWIGKDGDAGTLATLCTDDHPHFREARTKQSVTVRVRRLENVLAEQGIGNDLGVLTIDTEGMDYETVLGLDLERWRPRVIVSEDYPPKDARKAAYLESHRYRQAGHLAANSFWVPISR